MIYILSCLLQVLFYLKEKYQTHSPSLETAISEISVHPSIHVYILWLQMFINSLGYFIFSKWYCCVSFWNLLFSLNIAVDIYPRWLSSLFLLLIVFHYINSPQFIFPSPVCGHLDSFRFFSNTNSAAVAISYPFFLFHKLLLIFWDTPGTIISGS